MRAEDFFEGKRNVEQQLHDMQLQFLSAAAEEQAAGRIPEEMQPQEPGSERVHNAWAPGDQVGVTLTVDEARLRYLIACYTHLMVEHPDCPGATLDLLAVVEKIMRLMTEIAIKKGWFEI